MKCVILYSTNGAVGFISDGDGESGEIAVFQSIGAAEQFIKGSRFLQTRPHMIVEVGKICR